MGNRIERFSDFEQGTHRYLFLGDELHTGIGQEGHSSILLGSGRKRPDIRVAGAYLRSDDRLTIAGDGSISLGIEDRDPTPVADYIKSFPDSAGKTIITS